MAEKTNHKTMQAGKLVPESAYKRFLESKGHSIEFNPKTEGGFVWDTKTHIPTAYVRSPFWRAQERDTELHRADIRPVFIHDKEDVAVQKVETGGELELYAWDPNKQEAAPIMAKDSPVPEKLKAINNEEEYFVQEDFLFEELEPSAREIGFSAELANACIETNFHHSADPVQTALAMAHSLKKMAMVVEEQGWKLTPIAAFPHRPFEQSDMNQDDYVQRISHKYIKDHNIHHFLGSSFQVHVEMLDLESGLQAINMYQQVAPLLYAISLAGPFLHGQVNPNLQKIYQSDDTNQSRLDDSESYGALAHDDWMSVRYASRWRGSPSGGSFVEPLPTKAQDFYALAERGLRDDSPDSVYNIPSPARAAGHHRDRVRIDIGPHGTLEISNMDTFGGNVLKLAAVQEFTKVLMWKLQLYAKSGRMGELSKQFPELFPPEVTKETLRTAHLNSIEVAKRGVDAELQTPNGGKETACHQFSRLLSFVNEPISDPGQNIEYTGLSKGIINELVKSSWVPSREDYEDYTDDDRVVSISGFYKSGIGTLSHWLKRRANDLKALRGMNDEEAIKDCMDDLGTSYHEFLNQLNGDVKNLFV